MEIGKDENVKLAQVLKGTIKIISHFSEEGCAEMDMMKKVLPIRLNISEPIESGIVVETATKAILEERREIIKAVEVHQGLVLLVRIFPFHLKWCSSHIPAPQLLVRIFSFHLKKTVTFQRLSSLFEFSRSTLNCAAVIFSST